MVFPLWKSLHSLNLMLPKEDRKALLLRLYNDETPLVNLSHRNAAGTAPKVEIKVESSIDQEELDQRRNSSSMEEAEDGGVPIDDIDTRDAAQKLASDSQAGTSIS
jgi:multisite-specific tRNA:(cytosine-C5)-methyltransferase